MTINSVNPADDRFRHQRQRLQCSNSSTLQSYTGNSFEVNKQQLMQHTDVTWKTLLSLRALSGLASCNLYLCHKPTRTRFPNKAHIAQVTINFVRLTMSNTTKQGENAGFAAADVAAGENTEAACEV